MTIIFLGFIMIAVILFGFLLVVQFERFMVETHGGTISRHAFGRKICSLFHHKTKPDGKVE